MHIAVATLWICCCVANENAVYTQFLFFHLHLSCTIFITCNSMCVHECEQLWYVHYLYIDFRRKKRVLHTLWSNDKATAMDKNKISWFCPYQKNKVIEVVFESGLISVNYMFDVMTGAGVLDLLFSFGVDLSLLSHDNVWRNISYQTKYHLFKKENTRNSNMLHSTFWKI